MKLTSHPRCFCTSISLIKFAVACGCPLNCKLLNCVVLNGHLDVLQWLRSQTLPCSWSERTCCDAAQGGHLEILQWLRSQTPPCPWSERTCDAAAKEGHLEILQWLRSQTPPCPWSESTCNAAAEGWHLEILQWLRSYADVQNDATLLSWLVDQELM